MATITLQVLDGVDKGRVFRELPTPVTIGREEGNMVRLNDERVSRYHAKVQQDQEDVILTDLESTNGTRVNGNVVQIRRLRVGDCVTVGRSVLMFGSNEEIAARLANITASSRSTGSAAGGSNAGSFLSSQGSATIQARSLQEPMNEADLDFDLNVKDATNVTDDGQGLFIGNRALPALPLRMTPSQAARIAEIFDFLHRGLAQACDKMRSINEEGTQIVLDYATWQKILAVEMLLARYVRAIGEPDSWETT